MRPARQKHFHSPNTYSTVALRCSLSSGMLSARRRREGGADIDLPQLIERCVIEGRDGAIEKTEEYQAAAGRKRARGVRIGQMHVLLDLLGHRIDGGEVASAFEFSRFADACLWRRILGRRVGVPAPSGYRDRALGGSTLQPSGTV